MRDTRNINGILRLKNNRVYTPMIARYCSTAPHREQSEDTKIRRNIYRIIIEMIQQNKSNVEIEIYLRNLYPDYAEYIPKVINDQFAKRKLKEKTAEDEKTKNDGDER